MPLLLGDGAPVRRHVMHVVGAVVADDVDELVDVDLVVGHRESLLGRCAGRRNGQGVLQQTSYNMRLRGRGLHHRSGDRTVARPHRHPRAAPGARRTTPARAPTPSATWPRPTATTTRCGATRSTPQAPAGAASIAPPPLVGGDTLIGEDEVTEVARGAPRPDEGRPAARRARLLLGQRARVVGAAAARPPGDAAQRAGRRARQAERVRRARRARVDRPGLPRRRRPAPLRPVPADDPHRADARRASGRSTTRSSSRRTPTRRSTRSRRSTRRRRRAAPSRAGGRTWRRATRSAPW